MDKVKEMVLERAEVVAKKLVQYLEEEWMHLLIDSMAEGCKGTREGSECTALSPLNRFLDTFFCLQNEQFK